MDIHKLSQLKAVKKITINKEKSNKPKTYSILKGYKRAPHTVKCEVLFVRDKFYGLIGNERYPIVVTDKDYLDAKYAYSTPNNPNWDWFTLRKFRCSESNIESLKEFWQLIIPHIKVYIVLNNGVGRLDMTLLNMRNEKIFNKLSDKYYANRRN